MSKVITEPEEIISIMKAEINCLRDTLADCQDRNRRLAARSYEDLHARVIVNRLEVLYNKLHSHPQETILIADLLKELESIFNEEKLS